MTETKLLANLSKTWRTKIVTWVAESNSGTYGFSLYDKGKLVREVLSVGGDIGSSKAKRLKEEGSLDWAKATEDDLLQVVKRLGPAYEELPAGVRYPIYDLISQ